MIAYLLEALLKRNTLPVQSESQIRSDFRVFQIGQPHPPHECSLRRSRVRAEPVLRVLDGHIPFVSSFADVDSLGNAFVCKSIIVTGIPIFNDNGNLRVGVLSKNGSNANEGYNSNTEGGFFGAMANSGNEIIFGVSENFVINESGKTPMEFFGSASNMYGNKMFRTIRKMGRYFGGGIKLISFDKSGGALLSGSKFDFYGIDME